MSKKTLYETDHYFNNIERLVQIVNTLRVACPWDRAQTFESLLPQSREELFEFQDAVLNKDWENVKEELGDLLLHIMFYSKLGQEMEVFNFNDVIEEVANKLVRRHPHIYEYKNEELKEEEVKKKWEHLKKKEGKKSILSGVPHSIPALEKAYIIQNKAQHVGFEFDNMNQVMDKCEEEWQEVIEALSGGTIDKVEEELGDLLFSVVNLIRYKGLDPNRCLELTNQKFIQRFQYVESKVNASKKNWEDYDLERLDEFWKEAKK